MDAGKNGNSEMAGKAGANVAAIGKELTGVVSRKACERRERPLVDAGWEAGTAMVVGDEKGVRVDAREVGLRINDERSSSGVSRAVSV